MYDLEGKVALVTGSGRRDGLGEAIAKRLAADGAHIMLHDVGSKTSGTAPKDWLGQSDDLQLISEEIAAMGVQASFCEADLLIPAEVEELIASTVDVFGRIDIVVNNAGLGYFFSPITDLSIEHWDAILGVNLRAPFLTTKFAAPHMIRQGDGGRIVNIASVSAKRARPHVGAYCSSKHGLVGLTRTAALELAPHRITVNALCPNHVTTKLGSWQNEYWAQQEEKPVSRLLSELADRIPLGRVGLGSDTANACAFLCSDQAGYITAEAMNVSGGEEYH